MKNNIQVHLFDPIFNFPYMMYDLEDMCDYTIPEPNVKAWEDYLGGTTDITPILSRYIERKTNVDI